MTRAAFGEIPPWLADAVAGLEALADYERRLRELRPLPDALLRDLVRHSFADALITPRARDQRKLPADVVSSLSSLTSRGISSEGRLVRTTYNTYIDRYLYHPTYTRDQDPEPGPCEESEVTK